MSKDEEANSGEDSVTASAKSVASALPVVNQNELEFSSRSGSMLVPNSPPIVMQTDIKSDADTSSVHAGSDSVDPGSVEKE